MHRRLPVRAAAALLTALAGSVPAAAQSLPAPLAAAASLRESGAGEFRFFGFHIYDARLWVEGATAGAPARFNPAGRFVLGLRYARDFAGHRIAQQSEEEMARLGLADEARRARWREAMTRLFPDVKTGQELVGVNEPGRGASFYHDGRPIGSIDDPDFARAFFAIWLDPRTRAAGLRQRLLGLPGR